jgi:uncharacterized protein YdhG (YjbR/CyaY superfamily)
MLPTREHDPDIGDEEHRRPKIPHSPGATVYRRGLGYACRTPAKGIAMQSTAADVDTNLAEVSTDRRPVLTAIRQLCRETLPGYVEGMEYDMPSYARDGVVEVSFASQKQYISIYGLKTDVLNAHRADFRGAKIGKGCIRYTKPENVDLAAVERLPQATAATDGQVC